MIKSDESVNEVAVVSPGKVLGNVHLYYRWQVNTLA
jgi:hypothetical protein